MYRRCHFTAVSFCCPLEFQTRPLVGHRQRRTTSTSTTTGRTILFCAAAVMVVCLAPATAATTTAWSIARRGGRPASSGGNGLTRRHLWKQCQPNRLWQSAAGFTIATTNDNKIGCFFASSSTAASAAAATTLAPPATSSVALQSMDYSSNNQNDDTSTTTKPAALFLHGLLGNKRNFASIGTSLSQQIQTPRRLIGLDLRNHGMPQSIAFFLKNWSRTRFSIFWMVRVGRTLTI